MTVQDLIQALSKLDQTKVVKVSPKDGGTKNFEASNEVSDVEEFDDQVCLWRDL